MALRYGQTANSYSNPEGSPPSGLVQELDTSGGTILSFTNQHRTQLSCCWIGIARSGSTPTGKLVWGVNNGTTREVTSPLAYNDGNWHMVVVEIGLVRDRQLWVGQHPGSHQPPPVTSAQSFTGWWHLGWGDEPPGSDASTERLSVRFLGSMWRSFRPSSRRRTSPTLRYTRHLTTSFKVDMGGYSPVAYWPPGTTPRRTFVAPREAHRAADGGGYDHVHVPGGVVGDRVRGPPLRPIW